MQIYQMLLITEICGNICVFPVYLAPLPELILTFMMLKESPGCTKWYIESIKVIIYVFSWGNISQPKWINQQSHSGLILQRLL